MSASSRWPAELAAVVVATLAAFSSEASIACGHASRHVLPDPVRAVAPNVAPRGEGNLRWLGLLVYHARLWTAGDDWSEAPYALEIRYARALRGADIASRSVDEIRRTGEFDPAQLQRWGDAMRRTFPDVADGDCLVGVSLPAGGARFFHNGKPLGAIADPEFAPAFFGIWLSPRTSAPALRRRLLGISE
jgi:chalcone isomerase-like protein